MVSTWFKAFCWGFCCSQWDDKGTLKQPVNCMHSFWCEARWCEARGCQVMFSVLCAEASNMVQWKHYYWNIRLWFCVRRHHQQNLEILTCHSIPLIWEDKKITRVIPLIYLPLAGCTNTHKKVVVETEEHLIFSSQNLFSALKHVSWYNVIQAFSSKDMGGVMVFKLLYLEELWGLQWYWLIYHIFHKMIG